MLCSAGFESFCLGESGFFITETEKGEEKRGRLAVECAKAQPTSCLLSCLLPRSSGTVFWACLLLQLSVHPVPPLCC